MKKLFLWTWVYLYLAVAGLMKSLYYGYNAVLSDFEPYFGPLSFLQAALYMGISVIGVGLLGAWIAVIK